jgi:hypothetical protein
VRQVRCVLRRRHRQVVVQRDVIHLALPRRHFNPPLAAAGGG